jgi:hypothetical protein
VVWVLDRTFVRVVQVEERQQCEETGRELAEGEDAIGADADLWVYGECMASMWRVYGEYGEYDEYVRILPAASSAS